MLTGFLICLAAVLGSLYAAREAMGRSALDGLTAMLTCGLAGLISLRYFYVASAWLATYQQTNLAWIATAVFWVIFVIAYTVLTKIREAGLASFKPVRASWLEQAIAAVFGFAAGAFVTSCVVMTLTIVAPSFWAGYNAAVLPVRLDKAPVLVFRAIEAHLAGVDAKDPAHTLLPDLQNTASQDPTKFWQ